MTTQQADSPYDKLSKILLLPMCGLGDAVCYIPTVRALRAKFPEALITVVVVSEVARSILNLAECNTDVVVFNRGGEHSGWRQLLRFMRKVRSIHYDLVVSGAHTNTTRVPLFAAISGARLSIGARAEHYSFLYKKLVDIPAGAHAYVRFRALLAAMDINIAEAEYRPEVALPEDARALASTHLTDAGIKPDDLVIGIASGADTNARGIWNPYLKRWSIAKYVELVQSLTRSAGAKIIMFGGMAEKVIADEITQLSEVQIISYCGKTDIPELTWLLKRCGLIVTNDTGIMHLAAAVATPVLSLFGPTSANSFAPVGGQHRSIQGQIHCSPCYPHPTCGMMTCDAIDQISVDQVMLSVTGMLELPFRAGQVSLQANELIQIREFEDGES